MDFMIVVNWFESFFEQEGLPEVVQTFGIGLLTVLVAVAVFIVDKYSDFEFDRRVIFKHVIKSSRFLFSIILVFSPFFFWEFQPVLRLIFFLASLTGLFLLIQTLYRAYKWMDVFESSEYKNVENYRMKLRFQYLESVEDMEAKEGIWSYIWKSKSKSISEERKFIEVFLQWVEELINKKDEKSLTLAARHIEQLQRLSEHISFKDWTIFQDLFQSILQKYQDIHAHKKDNPSATHLRHTLERILGFFVQKSLQEGTAYIFFATLANQLKKTSCSTEFRTNTIKKIAIPFFSNVTDSADHLNIWKHYFPEEWKVNKETLFKENCIACLWLDEFVSWALSRIGSRRAEGDMDKHLDEVSRELFPTVDPIVWAIILTFCLQSFSPNKRIKALVERRQRFGLYSRVRFYHSSFPEESRRQVAEKTDKQDEKERKDTIDLAFLIFGSQFEKEEIKKYLEELNGLKYEEGTWQLDEKNQIKQIFEDMLNHIEKQSVEN